MARQAMAPRTEPADPDVAPTREPSSRCSGRATFLCIYTLPAEAGRGLVGPAGATDHAQWASGGARRSPRSAVPVCPTLPLARTGGGSTRCVVVPVQDQPTVRTEGGPHRPGRARQLATART